MPPRRAGGLRSPREPEVYTSAGRPTRNSKHPPRRHRRNGRNGRPGPAAATVWSQPVVRR